MNFLTVTKEIDTFYRTLPGYMVKERFLKYSNFMVNLLDKFSLQNYYDLKYIFIDISSNYSKKARAHKELSLVQEA